MATHRHTSGQSRGWRPELQHSSQAKGRRSPWGFPWLLLTQLFPQQPDPRLQLHRFGAGMEHGQPNPKEGGRGCRASWCSRSPDSSMLISRFPSSPEGISLLKVILLETRHSCSGLGCLLQPGESLQSHMPFDPLLPGYLPIPCPEDQ